VLSADNDKDGAIAMAVKKLVLDKLDEVFSKIKDKSKLSKPTKQSGSHQNWRKR